MPDNTKCTRDEWERANSVRVRVTVALRSGEVMFAFKSPDGAIVYHADPLPEIEFHRLGDWVIQDGEELEIEIRRFPFKWKKKPEL